MFLDNKYTKYYFSLIKFRQLNPCLTIYTEKHHIIPKSFDESNIVKLSGKEHVFCHKLLPKIVKSFKHRGMKRSDETKKIIHVNKKDQLLLSDDWIPFNPNKDYSNV